MKAYSGKELARALAKHGWTLMRVHGSRALQRGFLLHLLRMAGPSEADPG